MQKSANAAVGTFYFTFLVERGQVQLSQLHAQRIHTLAATGGEIGADDVRLLTFLHKQFLLNSVCSIIADKWHFEQRKVKNSLHI